jgi:hypothetical protein
MQNARERKNNSLNCQLMRVLFHRARFTTQTPSRVKTHPAAAAAAVATRRREEIF